MFRPDVTSALSDALTSPQIARQLGGNITSSAAFFPVQFTDDTDIDKATALIREVGKSISEDPFFRHNLQGPLEVFGVDRMDPNGAVSDGFRGQYSVSRAFNERLITLVEQNPDVHFAQTYPQPIFYRDVSCPVKRLAQPWQIRPDSGNASTEGAGISG